MSRRAAFFVLTMLATISGSTSDARDIYVDNVQGDDRRGGALPVASGTTGPCRTIAKALRIAGPGDRIIVANTGEPYRESLTLQGARHSGSDTYPFTIVGNGATLDGTASLAEANWEHVDQDVFRTRPPFLSHQQLFLNGQPAARRASRAAASASADAEPLAPLEWRLEDGWLYFRVEAGKLPQAYDLACCGQPTGITLYEVHDVVIEDLTVRGFWLDGVNCHDNVRRSDIARVAARENGRSGFSIGGASRVRLDNCTAAGNGVAQVRTEGFSVTALADNQIDPASAPAIMQEGGRIVNGE